MMDNEERLIRLEEAVSKQRGGMMDNEERLIRLEEAVFWKEKEIETLVLIDVPGAKFRMMKKQERDEEGDRIRGISYSNSIEKLETKGYRLITIDELRAMRDYAIQKLPDGKWKNVKEVEKLFGVEDMSKDEWIYDCEEVAGIRWYNRANAGPFCAYLSGGPSRVGLNIGFRCCRNVP